MCHLDGLQLVSIMFKVHCGIWDGLKTSCKTNWATAGSPSEPRCCFIPRRPCCRVHKASRLSMCSSQMDGSWACCGWLSLSSVPAAGHSGTWGFLWKVCLGLPLVELRRCHGSLSPESLHDGIYLVAEKPTLLQGLKKGLLELRAS